ncbi:MAG: phage tail tape measure protein, partial [Cetobacterium sp.]
MFAALTIDFNARLASVESDMRRIGNSAEALDRRLSNVGAGLKGAAIGAGVATIVGAFAAATKSSIDFADNLNDLSQKTGASVKDLASLKLAAEQNGTSIDQLGKGLGALGRNLIAARDGNKALSSIFQQLGVDGTDAQKAMFQLADRFKDMEDGAQKNALAAKIFGRAIGPELIPLLNQGGDALRESARQSESFAETMSRLAPQADKLNDDLALLKQNAAEFSAVIAQELVPALSDLLGGLTDVIGAMASARGSGGGVFRSVFSGMTAAFGEPAKEIKRLEEQIASIEAAKARLNDPSSKGAVVQGKFLFGDFDTQLKTARA